MILYALNYYYYFINNFKSINFSKANDCKSNGGVVGWGEMKQFPVVSLIDVCSAETILLPTMFDLKTLSKWEFSPTTAPTWIIYMLCILYIIYVRLLSSKFWRNCQRPHAPEYGGGFLGTRIMWGLSCESERSLTPRRGVCVCGWRGVEVIPGTIMPSYTCTHNNNTIWVIGKHVFPLSRVSTTLYITHAMVLGL